MRDIVFRGRRVGGDEWVYGDLLHDKDMHPHIVPQRQGFDIDEDRCEIYEVDPATVGIVAGRTDSKGEEIFNGDIVKVRFSVEHLIGEVVFGNGSFFLRFAPKQRSPLAIGFLTDIEMEVIGNIHDNPEILNPKQS